MQRMAASECRLIEQFEYLALMPGQIFKIASLNGTLLSPESEFYWMGNGRRRCVALFDDSIDLGHLYLLTQAHWTLTYFGPFSVNFNLSQIGMAPSLTVEYLHRFLLNPRESGRNRANRWMGLWSMRCLRAGIRVQSSFASSYGHRSFSGNWFLVGTAASLHYSHLHFISMLVLLSSALPFVIGSTKLFSLYVFVSLSRRTHAHTASLNCSLLLFESN